MKNLRLTNEQLIILNNALDDYKEYVNSRESDGLSSEKIEELIKEINGFTVDYFEEYLKQKDKKERVIHVVKALIGEEEANSVLKVILNDD